MAEAANTGRPTLTALTEGFTQSTVDQTGSVDLAQAAAANATPLPLPTLVARASVTARFTLLPRIAVPNVGGGSGR
jgi:hypothetical protein